MLSTQAIPLHEEDPEDWHRFLDKAAKGSIKAVDILTHANQAYMVALTGDPAAPDSLHLDDYHARLRETSPNAPMVVSLQEFHDTAHHANWFPQAFAVCTSPRNPSALYRGLWGHRDVDASALANDAMLLCLEKWSADHLIKCLGEHGLDYDSRLVVAAMLYLSLTWPET
jgi:hypothetical protein